MPLRTVLLLLLSLCTLSTIGQDLKSPSEFLGYELGTRFTRHHRVIDYYQYLSRTEKQRVRLEQYGETYEGRPLYLAYISSPANMADLENIRQAHLLNSEGTGNPEIAIVWMSYNVHGNESVSSEASMKTVYELLTRKGDYLKNTVVIVDPCVNPDGRERYVNWYHQFKNSPHQIDPNSKEHHEPWLNGRPNHYMFDLNRDWAWLTQLESRQRIKVYNKWLPHIHVDFHEQEVDNPYYFAPAAEPFHEVITDFQREFQVTVGKNHARYFDANGWFYFTKEVFDLLYPSYGDTFPTYNGSIGMTYEQGGSGRAGLAITTRMGDTLSLKDRLDHHNTTGLSTIEVASKNAKRLNLEFQKFHANKDYKYKNYVLNGNADKIKRLTELLERHEIKYGWAKTHTAKGFIYQTGKNGSLKTTGQSLVVPVGQKKGTLVKVLFEPNAKLSDSLTYDITAWSLPYAYGLDAVAVPSEIAYTTDAPTKNKSAATPDPGAYAYLSPWQSFDDARFLAALLQADFRVRYAKKPFVLDGREYERGSLIVTKGDNKHKSAFASELTQIASLQERTLTATSTGFVEEGKDFGSDSVSLINDTKVAVLSGSPTSTLRFGEVWHFFEQQLNYPITVIEGSYLAGVDLSDYDTLILPDGNGYSDFLDEQVLEKLKTYVKKGGKLIAMGHVLKAFSSKQVFGIKSREIRKDSSRTFATFEEDQREQIKKAITGAIFKTRVDNTHPLAFGYPNSYFSLKLGNSAFNYLQKGTVAFLEEKNARPVAGFAGSEAQKGIGETLVFGAEDYGKGQVVYLADNPLFRGFWENGKLFFANALFLVN
ncbi:M14 family metallopeptidase [Pseudozobellia thermophila]|uniref:Zinc carboxypeptidase n=1 Tax=Pseudozobellia thermophila TaxID=192903 RepID=A0A1M6MMQ6_9FLAO|nr:M14 family metallopeptidase [Pseudozobellia thermophila]SHJ84666.1 Zinc carboxypeptidase [Pseudozobellia thermophila]